MPIEYTGEYGTEVAFFIPYVYYLKTSGLLKEPIITYTGMSPYYFFLDEHEISYKTEPRISLPPERRHFMPPEMRSDDHLFSATNRPPPKFIAPPFYDYYKSHGLPFGSSKPMVIINNKYNDEWLRGPLNYFDINTLDSVINTLRNKFTIIYIRTNAFRGGDYSSDHNEEHIKPFYDKEFIKTKHPDVTLIEDILEQVNYPFNLLKCILQTHVRATITALGGANFFDAYFPSKHVIYKGHTPYGFLNKNYYQNQHDMLCPTPGDIMFATNTTQLLEYIRGL